MELTGFKSFADKTKLTFEHGVTSVVGPNGSGKSNISDAIRWVMGEMSAKSLRGSNMQDVIFAGTQARKPLGYAQVSLTLDNSDHALNIEYDEVTVTRCVYRSGESEYYINGASCRLKDIHELFMDTGLGREGYSIIGQGKVNEIVSGKADDRRYMFDEAAGISKFRHRKNEAERKLLTTEDNLVRINDIVSELNGQLEPLMKQSEKAKKYLGLREEMKKLEINIFMQKVDSLRVETDSLREKFDIVAQQLAQMQKDNATADEEAEMLNEEAQRLDAEIEQRRGECARAEVEIKGERGEIDVLKNNIESNKRLAERIERDILNAQGRLEELSAEAQRLAEERVGKDERTELLASEAAELNEKKGAISAQAFELSEKINSIKVSVIEKMNEAATIKSEQGSLDAFRKSFIQRREAIESEKLTAGKEAEKIERMRAESESALARAQEKADKSRADMETVDNNIATLAAENDRIKVHAEQKSVQLSRDMSQINMLREMEREHEGFAKSVKSILDANERDALGGVRMYGALSELITVEGEYATAVEVLLGGALQNVVVENEQDAKRAIAYLKENRMGRVTFLPVSSVKGRELDGVKEISTQKGYVGVASELVHCSSRYSEIVKSLLGRSVVADSMDNAIEMSKKFGYRFRIATLDGEIFNAGGSITGGSMNKSVGILSRAAQIKSLEEKCRTSKKELAELNGKLEELAKRADTLNIQKKGLDVLLRTAEQEIVRLKNDIEHIEAMASAQQMSGEAMEAELVSIEEQLSDTNARLAELINEATKNELAIEEYNSSASAREIELAALEEHKKELDETASVKGIELAEAKKDIAALEYRISEGAAQKRRTEDEIAEKQNEIADINRKNENLCGEIEAKEKGISDKKTNLEKLNSDADELMQKRDETRERARRVLDESKETREKVYALKEEQNRLDAKREKLEGELDSMSEKMWEEYEVTYLSAKEYQADIGTLTSAKARVSELRGAIRALGNVNVDAIEEYKSVRERYDFLSNQANDLEEAKKSLEKLIDSIMDKMKTQFEEQFEIINKKFSSTFTELFGGGRAELRLTDPDDILGSGVEIDAQPPGKKLQNLSLLSGGEMAFTAIALLFAILKVRPAPFCVLDEIEAALDESNVYRFADYIRQYGDKTQFILITHRRGTMEAADLLYGVTMQEKGVSKLLALKLDEAVKMQA